jgi:Na+/phosphate symporter
MDTSSALRLGPESLPNDVQTMSRRAVEMLALVRDAFRRQDCVPLERADRLGQEIHRLEKALIAHAENASADALAVPMRLERVGDNIELLIRAVRTMVAEGVPFSERAMREVETLFARALELLECVRDVLITGNRVLVRYVVEHGRGFENLTEDFARVHQQRLIEGVCMPRASSLYLAMLDDLKGVEWHTRQIASGLVGGQAERDARPAA